MRDRIYVEDAGLTSKFPFLFGGTFIEGLRRITVDANVENFPSFSEGLSLRGFRQCDKEFCIAGISLPFRRDFH